ncbi:hypothetical protein BH09SUM1_BH09SUM1_32300 [soil metagenome]
MSKRWPSPAASAVILFVIALAVRFGNMWFTSASPLFWFPTSDEYEHYALATHLAAGDWLGREWGPFHRPQLFAYVIAILFKIFGVNFLVEHIFLGLIDSLGVLGWWGAARRAFSRRTAFLGALLIAIYRPFVHFAGTGYMESFAIAMNGFFIYLLFEHAMRTQRKGAAKSPWPPLIGAGILGGLCILTRPTLILLMPMFGFALLWLHWRRERVFLRSLIAPAAFAAIVTITISPNAIRHAALFHLWAPMGTGSELNFHMSNNRDGWGWEVSSPGIEYKVYQNFPIIEGGVSPDVESVRKWWAQRNSQYIHEEPGRLLRGIAVKYLQVWNRYEVHCTNNFACMKTISPIEAILPGSMLPFSLGIAGMFGFVVMALRLRPRNDSISRQWSRTVLLLWIVIYSMGVAVFLAITRHRLPMLPPLMLFAAWGATSLATALMRRSFASVIAWCAAFLVGVFVTTLDVIPDWMPVHEKWWTQVSLGLAEMQGGNPSAAARDFRSAIAIYPAKLEPYAQLAPALSQLGEKDEAIAAQKEVLALLNSKYPKYYMIRAEELEKLIGYQLRAGKFNDAEAAARELVALVPEAAMTHLVLANALHEAGKREEADAELKAALSLEPGSPAAAALEAHWNDAVAPPAP